MDSAVAEGVPRVAVKIVITGEQKASGSAKIDGRNTAQNLIVSKFVHLGVASHVEQPAGGVVGSRTEGLAIGEEGDGVDVGLMSDVGLDGLAGPDVPNLGGGVHAASNEDILVFGVEGEAHYISRVAGVGRQDLSGANIPQDTGGVTRRREDASFVDKAAAAQISVVRYQLLLCPGLLLRLLEVVYRAHIVQTAARDEVALGLLEGAGHDPRRPQRYGLHLVGAVGVPNDQFAVLRRRHEVVRIAGPVHGVNFPEMSFQRPSELRRRRLANFFQRSLRRRHLVDRLVRLLRPDLVYFILELFHLWAGQGRAGPGVGGGEERSRGERKSAGMMSAWNTKKEVLE